MLSKQRSLRTCFLVKLSVVLLILELLFSLVFYQFVHHSIESEIREALVKQGKYVINNHADITRAITGEVNPLKNIMSVKLRLDRSPDARYHSTYFRSFTKNNRYYLEAYVPYEFSSQRYLVLTADITRQKLVQNTLVKGILFVNALGMIIVLIYAYYLSGLPTGSIRIFSQKISVMNERALTPIKLEELPDELASLGKSVNHLTKRIQSFLNYNKELFIGTAHELKTPLAVMKAKSQVVLLKKHSSTEEYIEALQQNILSIDEINKIISSILKFGRAEGAQFEERQTIDVANFLRKICDEFSLLALRENKEIYCRVSPVSQQVTLPPLLLKQIIQNLLQNALRFTQEGGKVKLTAYRKNQQLFIKIRDEGTGIDETLDLFAPFKRSSSSPGVGLGLFLVKSACNALQADITLLNRKDKKGAVATLVLPLD